ncbi:MAG: hypothetical protein IPP63_11400 [Chloracidobacterium sp.]|nr:hypothetical protein [Chloracidobacterium sp.]
MSGALAKLPVGSHEIAFDFKSYNYKDAGESIAKGKFTLVVRPDAKTFFAKNEKDSVRLDDQARCIDRNGKLTRRGDGRGRRHGVS